MTSTNHGSAVPPPTPASPSEDAGPRCVFCGQLESGSWHRTRSAGGHAFKPRATPPSSPAGPPCEFCGRAGHALAACQAFGVRRYRAEQEASAENAGPRLCMWCPHHQHAERCRETVISTDNLQPAECGCTEVEARDA